jgi:hypothetical protein
MKESIDKKPERIVEWVGSSKISLKTLTSFLKISLTEKNAQIVK